MASYNRVIMMGNLTRDPEYKQLNSGQAVCRLGLASNRQFKNRQSGEMIQEVCFIDVDVWGAQADSCNQYLQKGRSVLVEGRIKLDSWQDSEGNRRSKHSIVADRVTFMPTVGQPEAQSHETTVAPEPAPQKAPAAKKAKPAPAKAATAPSADPAAKAVAQTSVGEVAFKDQAPFEDDLPF